MKTVFLGGTCNKSNWRETLLKLLDPSKVDAYNPVVSNWVYDIHGPLELLKRKTSDYVLYVLTPKMTVVYSIAEVVDDSNKRPNKTLFCILPEDDGVLFADVQLESLKATKKMVSDNGAKVFDTLQEVADFLNG